MRPCSEEQVPSSCVMLPCSNEMHPGSDEMLPRSCAMLPSSEAVSAVANNLPTCRSSPRAPSSGKLGLAEG